MVLIRDIMFCKPGKTRPMVEKAKALGALFEKHKMGRLRVTTDLAAERFWTVVLETEAESVEKFGEAMRKSMDLPEFQEAMKGYHDLVESGRREIYTIES